MAHEISLICDFLFGSIRTNLLMDTVNIELTVWMVKGIYTYGKDHTMESMIFPTWSKKVTPFPSLRHKIQAIRMIREVRKYCHGIMAILFSSLPSHGSKGFWQNQSQVLKQIQIQPYENKKAQHPRNNSE